VQSWHRQRPEERELLPSVARWPSPEAIALRDVALSDTRCFPEPGQLPARSGDRVSESSCFSITYRDRPKASRKTIRSYYPYFDGSIRMWVGPSYFRNRREYYSGDLGGCNQLVKRDGFLLGRDWSGALVGGIWARRASRDGRFLVAGASRNDKVGWRLVNLSRRRQNRSQT